MTDLLTPEEVREAHLRWIDKNWVDMTPDERLRSHLCRDYLTLWDHNEKLQKEYNKAVVDRWRALGR